MLISMSSAERSSRQLVHLALVLSAHSAFLAEFMRLNMAPIFSDLPQPVQKAAIGLNAVETQRGQV